MGLAVSGLAKGYPGLSVLRDLDLAVADGEVVAIRGQSGTGKSTLLHCLGLLDRADAGAIMLGGRDLAPLTAAARADARARHIGFVFQAFNLLLEFDALENVLIPARILGLPLAAATAEARALLERIGLGTRMHADVRTLSGGERQRVSLCRALLTKPALLLADEPTGNLDPATAKIVLDELVTLARDRKASVVIVTHDGEIAKRADRTLELREGRLW
ncbi:MAG TPA: ABC transporter ATP-binding protein [Planctomycetota bacterium]|nr:ABC transporter ATP-binding protein [Planctomycetota bacterium]